jgi:ABC-2 type transport system permease protein
VNDSNLPPPSTYQRRSPLWELVLARLREFIRQPEAIFWSYFFPVLLVLALGLAFQTKPEQKVVVDIESGTEAARLQELLSSDKKIEVHVNDADATRLRLRTGRTALVISSAESDSASGSYAYVFDPIRPESAQARLLVDDALQRAAGRKDPIAVTDHHVKEPGSRYVDFLVPGMLGMNIMAGGLWGVGFAIVYMRLRKLLKRLVATPMRRSHFLIGIMISRLLFLIPGVFAILIFSWLVFDVRTQGSFINLVIFILAGAFTFSGIGLLVACRADTIETVSGLMNLVMLPMWVFSGVFFSSENFPAFMQPFIRALPLTPLIDGLRATMLEAQPLNSPAQAIRLAVLLGWGAVTFALALRWFRWS